MVFGAMDASTSHWGHSSRRHAESIDHVSPDFTSALARRETKIDAWDLHASSQAPFASTDPRVDRP